MEIRGERGPPRDLRRQNRRKPLLCQRRMVCGSTIRSASSQDWPGRARSTIRTRSMGVSLTRPTWRCKTIKCRRSRAFSTTRFFLPRRRSDAAPRTMPGRGLVHLRTLCSSRHTTRPANRLARLLQLANIEAVYFVRAGRATLDRFHSDSDAGEPHSHESDAITTAAARIVLDVEWSVDEASIKRQRDGETRFGTTKGVLARESKLAHV